MRALTRTVLASALVAIFLALPAGLAAKGKRGANLVVTKLDGTQVSGELIAVKPDSLLLLGDGTDISVSLTDIRSVRIVRRSHAALFAGIGGAAGATAGAIVGFYTGGGDDETGPARLRGGAILGTLGALAGLALSQVLGTDTTFPVAGEPDAQVREYWDRLQRYSREGRLPVTPRPGGSEAKPIRRPGMAGPETPSTTPPASRRESRFGLRLSAWGHHTSGPSELSVESGSFRLLDGPSSEQGPYPLSFVGWHETGAFFAGPTLSLVYEWKDRLSAEVELFDLGSSINTVQGPLPYTSTADGKTYVSWHYERYRARFTGLLFGLSYRSAAPRAFRRHIVEFGAAAGPALVRGLRSWEEANLPDGVPNPIGRKVIISGRLQAAYDFYLYPDVSIGVVAGARFMAVNASGLVASGGEVFYEDNDPMLEGTVRLTEITFPTLPVKASGLYWGLRFGFRL